MINYNTLTIENVKFVDEWSFLHNLYFRLNFTGARLLRFPLPFSAKVPANNFLEAFRNAWMGLPSLHLLGHKIGLNQSQELQILSFHDRRLLSYFTLFMIGVCCIVLFYVVLISQFEHRFIEPRLIITEQSIEGLKAEGIPDDVLEKLEKIKNQEMRGEHQFVQVLKTTLGDALAMVYKSMIWKHTVSLTSDLFLGFGIFLVVLLIQMLGVGVEIAHLINFLPIYVDHLVEFLMLG